MPWHLLADRTRTLPPPPPFVREDLLFPRAEGIRAWLDLLADEIAPRIEATQDGPIVWSSLWPARPALRIVLDVTAHGSETALRFRLESPEPVDDPSAVGHYRRRLNELFFRDLRQTYGQ
ncbi:MAG: hypothetical protein V9G19_13230 [Tetrasphaera sp.]